MAEKPHNFEEMAQIWTDPQQWAIQVGIYNDQVIQDGDQPTDPGFTPRHARQAREYLMRQARNDGLAPSR